MTEMVFIIDKSGSMAGYESDTLGGFNSMIERQRAVEGGAYVSTVMFSDDSVVIHDRVDIREIKPLTEEDYRVGGCTALLDAIGSAIRHIGNVHKYARPEDVPEHTVFVITTDGMENASCNYSAKQIKDKIKRQSEKYGWEFIFMAANIDALETAGRMGIRRERAMGYTQDHEGVRDSYRVMADAVCCMRADPQGFKDRDIKDIAKKGKSEEDN
jgi:Mg-chelatase subunit ChlD